jgi:hypothetical protein
MSPRGRRAALVITAVAVAALSGGASAASAAITVSVGSSGPLVFRLYVQVPVTATCDPVSDPTLVQSSSASASLQQVQGVRIARGDGYVSPLTCDGTAHTYTVNVYPYETPFRAGPAVVSAFASVCEYDPTDYDPYTCSFASTGPQRFLIRG